MIALISFIVLFVVLYQFVTQPRVNEATVFKISGALEALNFWSGQRAYPSQTIPDIGHYAAFEKSRKAVRLNKTTNVESWYTIGPHNLGGRTLALAFNPLNPNTIYAGSASGGLWRSYSGGRGANAWEYVSTGFPVLAVSSIAFASDDSNTIYIGTGEVYNYQAAGTGEAFRNTRGSYGLGVLKTTDGGLTWTRSLDWAFNQQRGVWAVKINPLNPNTIWAGTTEGTFKSTDAGATWTQVHDVIMVMDLVINPVDTNIVFTACGNFSSVGHGIYRTMDGGAAWTKLTQGLPPTFAGKAMLDIYEPSPSVVYASIGNGFFVGGPNNASWLCQSVDNGETWVIVSTRDYSKWQGWFAHDVAVNPKDLNEVIAVGIEIYKSTTGGSNLIRKSTGGWFSRRVPPEGPEGPPTYSHVDHHDVVYHPTIPNIIYFANDGGVFRTTDGGETFESCNGGYQTSQFYGGFSSSVDDSLLSMGGFQDNSTAIYDGQLAWIVRLIGGDGAWTAIDPTNDNIIYGSWQFLNLRKSTNRGQSFFGISVPNFGGGTTSFIAPFVIGMDSPDVIYAGRDIVYKSITGGQGVNAWSATNNGAALDGNPVLAMAISHQNSDVVYAATAPFVNPPGVFRTLNGGITWDDITTTLPDRFPGDMAVDPTDEAIVYIVFSGFGTSHAFKSIDFGSTWQDIGQSLPDVPTSAVVVDPKVPNHIYVGNDIGVYVSTDGGETWQEFSEGFPEAVLVMDLSISRVNRKLRVATHGNGAFERTLLEGQLLPGRRIRIEPQSLNFGTLEVGQSSDSFTITVSNIGQDSLTVSSITNNSPSFTVSGVPSVPLKLSSFADISFSVAFTPISPGALIDTISIQSDDTTNALAMVALSGHALGTATFSGTVTDSLTNAPINTTLEFLRQGATEPRAIASTNPDGSYSVVILEGTYDITVVPEIPYPEARRQNVEHTLAGTVADFMLRPAPIVFVEDDSAGMAGQIYRGILEELGHKFSIWNTIKQGATVPADRLRLLVEPKILLWVTGETTTDVLTLADREAIIEHLTNGNALILTGDNIAETSPLNDSLVAGYLGVEFNSNFSQVIILGFPGDPIGDGLTTGAPGASKDQFQLRISPKSHVNKVFHYGTTPADTVRIAAIRAQDSVVGWKAAYFGFRLEAVTQLNRKTVIERTINWLSESPPVSVEDSEIETLPLAFSLKQNYPNPFNPSTTIFYELPKATFVTLKVYNLLGQEVATLLNEEKTAGSYKVQFDASNLAGGIYLYRLQAGEFFATRKLTLLK